MKKLFIATIAIGAAIAGLLLYMQSDQYAEKKTADDISDAAEDAYDTMNKHIGRAEHAFDHTLN